MTTTRRPEPVRRTGSGKKSGKARMAMAFLLVLLVGGMAYLYLTNEGVATELRQLRQPRPNHFLIAIDVSATIDEDTLEKFKDGVIERLRQFIGDPSVAYDVMTFGNPGCAEQSFRTILSLSSPADAVSFGFLVEEKIKAISTTKVAPRDTTPLTTPLHHFLDTALPPRAGQRIVIFSDVMNDDSDCPRQFVFPERGLDAYGADKSGQLVILYPTPQLTENRELNQKLVEKQDAFIRQVEDMSRAGRVRSFFYHIPDTPIDRIGFFKSRLAGAIPATAFEVVWERATRVAHTIVSAVRG